MKSVTFLSCLVVSALLVGCRSDPGFRGAAPGARSASPDAAERAACVRGQYPVDVDGAAYARARQADLQAARSGAASGFETTRLLDERGAFERRCLAWLAARGGRHPVETASFHTTR
jgi:hypothetical protein